MNETFWKTQIATRTPIPLERQKYVELDENVFLYSNWLDEHDHYATWDTKAVNPYGFDGRQFKDTLNIQLFDPNDEASFSMPVDSRDVTSYFGMRRMTWHYGADIRVKHGSEIKAAFDGVVRIAKYNRGGYGYYIMLRHANGSETLYGHLSAFNVSVGDEVKAGDVIGFGGSTGRSTGPHLHFEIRYLGNALNPHDIFDFRKGEIISADITISPDSFAYLHEAYKIRYHKIRRGDSLSRIARQYGTSVNTICRLNGISPNTTIYPGRSIRIK
ncbi:MAG: peptidoglycan DD-metalloendopeptidase family protein [Cyclobacteriaceae bacterium]|nr:peptidoglycan DD-metalloendopeptidase family protein [Cyclobacteriaceae bacterium]